MRTLVVLLLVLPAAATADVAARARTADRGAAGVKVDHVRAVTLYRKVCAGGDAPSCERLPSMLGEGDGTKVDAKRARAAELRACELGDWSWCSRLADDYEMGLNGAPVDEKRARSLAKSARAAARKACQRGRGDACLDLAFYSDPPPGDAEALVARGLELVDEACQDGAAAACARAAQARVEQGAIHDEARAAADGARAATLATADCDGGDVAVCLTLEDWLARGQLPGIAVDGAKAAAVLERLCQGGDAQACSDAASLRLYPLVEGVESDPEKATALLAKACDGAIAEACVSVTWRLALGEGLERKDSAGADRRADDAVRLYTRACEAGDARACDALGDLYQGSSILEEDEAEATRWHTRGCRLGASCCYVKSDLPECGPIP